MSKPREYHLNPKGTWLKVTPLIADYMPSEFVHVIEKSAYEELESKLVAMEQNWREAIVGGVAHHEMIAKYETKLNVAEARYENLQKDFVAVMQNQRR